MPVALSAAHVRDSRGRGRRIILDTNYVRGADLCLLQELRDQGFLLSEGNAASTRGVFAEVESYDPIADRWTALRPMRTPRHGTGGAALGRALYVPGGADRQAFGAVAVVEAYTP